MKDLHFKFALIYGSAAKGETSKWSDIDVLVVGDVSFAEIGEKLIPAQKTLQREINPSVSDQEVHEMNNLWANKIIS